MRTQKRTVSGDSRRELLTQWAQSVAGALGRGLVGDPVRLRGVDAIAGPRAGALELDAGLAAGRVLAGLGKDDNALVRQLIPWNFVGEPAVYLSRRYVRLEAGWPADLAESDIPLASLGQFPTGGGRWIAGKNESGATITLGVDDRKPHWLFGGWAGSGKTWALRSALAQLAHDPANRIVLVDAKWGASFACLSGLPGLVGPVATDLPMARNALSWAVLEMRRRYEGRNFAGRVIVAIDEVQELTDDAGAVALLRRLVVQGRGAAVHVLLGTQHPTKNAFGDPAVKRNLTGRLALRVEDGVASNVVVGGSNPRADRLLGAGDAYAVTPSAVQRLQVAYIPENDLEAQRNGGPDLDAWPDFDPEAAGTLPENRAPCFEVSGTEAAVAILAASLGKGRPALQRMIGQATGSTPGGGRSKRLLDLGREGWDWLTGEGWALYDAALEDDALEDEF